jgi:hypothetical protein
MYKFTERQKQADVEKFLRRLADRAASKWMSNRCERRNESRCGQSMPVYMARWDGASFSKEEATIALSRDVSSQGIAVVVVGPFQAKRVVMAFWVESRPCFALGEVHNEAPMGGGYRRLGIELIELLDVADHPSLQELIPLTARLAPMFTAEAANRD